VIALNGYNVSAYSINPHFPMWDGKLIRCNKKQIIVKSREDLKTKLKGAKLTGPANPWNSPLV